MKEVKKLGADTETHLVPVPVENSAVKIWKLSL
jgi:hypothetical protein